jgi:hypothetical protein
MPFLIRPVYGIFWFFFVALSQSHLSTSVPARYVCTRWYRAPEVLCSWADYGPVGESQRSPEMATETFSRETWEKWFHNICIFHMVQVAICGWHIFRSISYGYRVLECRDPNRRDVVFEGGSGSCDFDAVINSAACFRILWYASCFMLFLDLVWVCRVHLKTSYERPKQIETMGSDPPWRCHPARPYLSRPSICGP